MSSGHAQLGSQQIGASTKGQRFEIVHVSMNGLVVERSLDVVVIGNRFEPKLLAKSSKRLDFGEFGRKYIRLELQQLQFDLEQVPFAHVAGFEAGLTDFDGLLKAVVVLLGEVECGLREQNVDELLGKVEGELALVVSHLSARHGGRVFRGLIAALALPATLEEVTDADVELRLVLQIARVELAGIEEGEKLRIPRQCGIGAEIRCDFLGLILKNGRLRGKQGVIVLQRQPDGLVECEAGGRGRAGVSARGDSLCRGYWWSRRSALLGQ